MVYKNRFTFIGLLFAKSGGGEYGKKKGFNAKTGRN